MSQQDSYMRIKSPCVSICEYNEHYYCVGCKRHMDDIIDWLDYSDEKRASVMQELPTRDISEPSGVSFKTF